MSLNFSISLLRFSFSLISSRNYFHLSCFTSSHFLFPALLIRKCDLPLTVEIFCEALNMQKNQVAPLCSSFLPSQHASLVLWSLNSQTFENFWWWSYWWHYKSRLCYVPFITHNQVNINRCPLLLWQTPKYCLFLIL